VQRDVNVLSNVFTIARDEWKWINDTPFRGFNAPGDNPPRIRRIQPTEIRRLLRHLGYVVGAHPASKSAQTGFAFLISLRTGMRAGEILALNKSRVDLPKRLASVPHKTEHLTGRPRIVPLSKHAIRLLAPFQRGFEWTVTSASLDALFRKARESLLIHDLHFHDARADALTRFARKVDVMQLARISGHKDLRILMDHYYRVTPAEIAGRLDAPISRPLPVPTGSGG
jgi:integrase